MGGIGRVAVLTSGGDAPGMNAAIRSVVRGGIDRGLQIVGVESGYEGLIEGRFRDMNNRSVSNIIQEGGTCLGTSRSPRFMEPGGRAQAFERLRDAGIDGLIVIGGNGSFRGAHALHQETGIAVVGVPGTIDNDVGGTDVSIGFDTAVNTALEALDRLRDTAFSLHRPLFVEVMGRKCGAIAVASALAGGAEEVLVPERPEPIEGLIDRIRKAMDRGKRSLMVVVAEGESTGGARAVADRVGEALEIAPRVTVLGYIQRGGSPTANDRILGARLGLAAVDALRAGSSECMVGMSGGRTVTRSLADSWTSAPLDLDDLLDLCSVLAH